MTAGIIQSYRSRGLLTSLECAMRTRRTRPASGHRSIGLERRKEITVPTVDVYEKDEMKPLFEGEFAFLPRLGETISKDMGDYFHYYNVVEVWHREDGKDSVFRAYVRVEIDD
jgi:hypothetical protein